MANSPATRTATEAVDALEKEVLGADAERYRAMVNCDLAALERLLSPDLTYTHSSAHRENKSEYIASLSSGRVRYESTRCDDVSVRINGETAILEGHSIFTAIVDGVARDLDNRFLSVWLRQDGNWQMAAWASTPIPAPIKLDRKNAD